jgi:PhoH-like ATPase
MTSRVYVLDTNVLLYAPEAIYAFPEAEVVIPIGVVEEVDKFKSDMSQTGNSAREAANRLDSLREQGSLANGVSLPHGGTLRVDFRTGTPESFPVALDPRRASNRTLAVAWALHQQGHPVVLISQDTNLRVKAGAMGIAVGQYEGSRSRTSYDGFQRHSVDPETFRALQKQHSFPTELQLHPNEGAIFEKDGGPPEELVARFSAQERLLHRLDAGCLVWGVHPRNAEQRLALELLLDPQVAVVTLSGKAGTGKTLLALAAGLQMTLIERQYSRMLVSRPIFPMGRDLGYLPGELQDKLGPWMQPIFDNLEQLIDGQNSSKLGELPKRSRKGYQDLLDQGVLVVEPLTYIRGRSIPKQYMIVDEAQNLTPHEMKTIVTRAGEGTKIVLTGDPYQIDNPYLDTASNGLSVLVERFKAQSIAGHVKFQQGERSALAELAANIL